MATSYEAVLLDDLILSVRQMLNDAGYSVKKTGRIFSINGTEYNVTNRDGDTVSVWSPPFGQQEDGGKEVLAMLSVALNVYRKE